MILLNRIISFIWELYMSKDNSDSVKIWTGEKQHSKPRLMSSVCKTVGCYFIIWMCISAVNNKKIFKPK